MYSCDVNNLQNLTTCLNKNVFRVQPWVALPENQTLLPLGPATTFSLTVRVSVASLLEPCWGLFIYEVTEKTWLLAFKQLHCHVVAA